MWWPSCRFVHCVPGGSAFSGEYVVFWHLELISVYFCLVSLWIEVGPRVPIRSSVCPQVKIKLEPNWSLMNILWATSSTSSCNFPVCSLHLSGPHPSRKLCCFDQWTRLPRLWLATHGSLKSLKVSFLLKWLSALHTTTCESRVSFLICLWLSPNAYLPHPLRSICNLCLAS